MPHSTKSTKKTFIGFHGTELDTAYTIKEKAFKVRKCREHWLGDGVYFFIDGISASASNDAENWAIAEAWDKKNQKYSYMKYAILKAKISIDDDKLLDLTKLEGLKFFNTARKILFRKIKLQNKRLKTGDYRDHDVLDFILTRIEIQNIMAHFYIKSKDERVARLLSRIPNTTVLCNCSPELCIEKDSIEIIKEGIIPT